MVDDDDEGDGDGVGAATDVGGCVGVGVACFVAEGEGDRLCLECDRFFSVL
jgi:hypothetical protein